MDDIKEVTEKKPDVKKTTVKKPAPKKPAPKKPVAKKPIVEKEKSVEVIVEEPVVEVVKETPVEKVEVVETPTNTVEVAPKEKVEEQKKPESKPKKSDDRFIVRRNHVNFGTLWYTGEKDLGAMWNKKQEMAKEITKEELDALKKTKYNNAFGHVVVFKKTFVTVTKWKKM